MKKFFVMIFLGFSTLFFVACGGSDSSSTEPIAEVPVSQIGTWQVTTTMTGNSCEGLTAEMIQIIEPSISADDTRPTIHYEGNNFEYQPDGSCILVPISGDDRLNGPVESTKSEFEASEWNDFDNKDDIDYFGATVYTDQQISIEIKYKNGSTLYQTSTRI